LTYLPEEILKLAIVSAIAVRILAWIFWRSRDPWRRVWGHRIWWCAVASILIVLIVLRFF
jgi:hypothetical protein